MACLAYTSGTAGPPKGALNTHASAVHNALVYARWMCLASEPVILGAAPLFHITGTIAYLTAGPAALTPRGLLYQNGRGGREKRAGRHRMSQGRDRMELEVGLKRAIQWISEQRQGDPKVSLASLIDEASRRFDLSPLQADFLYRHFAKSP